MSEIEDKIRQANQDYVDYRLGSVAPPKQRVAILTCMDARIEPLEIMGLAIGDAHVIRNAGGRASDDAIRSLLVSAAKLGTTEWFVIHHTDCGMEIRKPEDNDFANKVTALGVDPDCVQDIDYLTFTDLDQSVRDDVNKLRRCVPTSINIYGYVYEVKTGFLRKVV